MDKEELNAIWKFIKHEKGKLLERVGPRLRWALIVHSYGEPAEAKGESTLA